ncbi:hypothetical protein DRJ16_03015 [Candidatus Woesearchaeota archaeon]|nr:MAG: hypothetical protein DRJ16_03015 [Candidatus Woesearchaeota archaeon]
MPKQRYMIIYSLSKQKPKQKARFNRELFGYKDSSNFGKYSYNRRGLLLKTDFSKPFPTTIILRKTAVKKIPKLRILFRKYKVKYRIYRITGGAGI